MKKERITIKSDLSEPRGININPYLASIGIFGWAAIIGGIIGALFGCL